MKGEASCFHTKGTPSCFHTKGTPYCFHTKGSPPCFHIKGTPSCFQTKGSPSCFHKIEVPSCFHTKGTPCFFIQISAISLSFHCFLMYVQKKHHFVFLHLKALPSCFTKVVREECSRSLFSLLYFPCYISCFPILQTLSCLVCLYFEIPEYCLHTNGMCFHVVRCHFVAPMLERVPPFCFPMLENQCNFVSPCW